MPKNARYSLVWSPLYQAYELHERQDGGVRDIVSASPAWLARVSQEGSFAFHGRSGSYTACKENKQCNEGYWYAYTRMEGKLIKRYLGKNISLTIPRLEQVAQELGLDRSAGSLPKEGIGEFRFLSSSTRQEMAIPPTSLQHFQYSASPQGDDADAHKSSPESTALPTDQLLATKIHVPRLRPRLVHRPRLIQRLDQGKERILTLISAPVGFGKSTLLADWLASGATPVVWLSLDPQDNEPERFLSYLYAAMQTYYPNLDIARQVLNGPLLETMLTLLMNDLLTQRANLQEHIVLVLDNYQVITDLSIHHALSFLLNHMPPQMHLVLATREDPPLPLAQLRGRDDMLELRAAELRFTPEEADTFLVEAMGLPLSHEESILMQVRTEGWITGLQLAAISLQGRDNPLAFITAFSGSNHYVVDYLFDEVLNRQSEAVQNFLLGTCILDRLSAPLCDAVLRSSGSQALLDFLERTNLFLVPLDDERDWYRYNRLFAEALRQLLRQTSPALIPTLHLRASYWYEQQGLFTEAGSHASAAHIHQAVPLIEPLTAREREVAQLLLDGASNQEIAQRLDLSVNTVKKHVLNICRKLNVRSRTQVIAKARTFRLL